MTRKDIIYLYQDENKPKVQLTLIKNSMKLQEIIDYFHNLQKLYNMEFQLNETITENLKVCCSSPGVDPTEVPFYIIEYDEIYDSFYIWKSNGNWNLNQIIKNLYQLHNSTMEQNTSWKRKFSRDKQFKTHPLKNLLVSALNQLNLDWNNIDINKFWNQFNSIYDQFLNNNDPESINEYTLKSLISMTVLKLNVMTNQEYLKDTFHQYYSNMNKKQQQSMLINNTHNKNDNVVITDDETTHSIHELTRSSSEESILSPPTKDDLHNIATSANNKDIAYISPRSSVSPSPINPLGNILPTGSSYTYDNKNNKNNTQLLVNFNNHFKEVAEHYENIQLRSRNKKLNNHSIKKNVNKITK
ncbi:hypothetical protein MOUN0_M03796 [Monosporozyma unispora]|nr:hypothetical protein C6P44_005003 [Kazachstania unispora]